MGLFAYLWLWWVSVGLCGCLMVLGLWWIMVNYYWSLVFAWSVVCSLGLV